MSVARDRVPLAAWRLNVLAVVAVTSVVTFYVGALGGLRLVPDDWLWALVYGLPVAGVATCVRGGIGDLVLRLSARLRQDTEQSRPAVATESIAAGIGAPEYRAVLGWTVALAAPCFLRPGAPSAVLWIGVALLMVVPALWRLRHGKLLVHRTAPVVRRGEPVTFSIGTSDGGARIDDLWCVFRCIRQERLRLGLHATDAEVWAATLQIAPELHVGPGTEVVATFHPPADTPPTDLLARDPVAWELVVVGKLGRRPYVGRVPVHVG